mmetsp:Transcript_1977/g.5226  ORF Transcript_1977/g.5226 Transcript_1977/m.5226 type:complete len:224 (-) Transcript_1977:991-1662(-)
MLSVIPRTAVRIIPSACAKYCSDSVYSGIELFSASKKYVLSSPVSSFCAIVRTSERNINTLSSSSLPPRESHAPPAQSVPSLCFECNAELSPCSTQLLGDASSSPRFPRPFRPELCSRPTLEKRRRLCAEMILFITSREWYISSNDRLPRTLWTMMLSVWKICKRTAREPSSAHIAINGMSCAASLSSRVASLPLRSTSASPPYVAMRFDTSCPTPSLLSSAL